MNDFSLVLRANGKCKYWMQTNVSTLCRYDGGATHFDPAYLWTPEQDTKWEEQLTHRAHWTTTPVNDESLAYIIGVRSMESRFTKMSIALLHLFYRIAFIWLESNILFPFLRIVSRWKISVSFSFDRKHFSPMLGNRLRVEVFAEWGLRAREKKWMRKWKSVRNTHSLQKCRDFYFSRPPTDGTLLILVSAEQLSLKDLQLKKPMNINMLFRVEL